MSKLEHPFWVATSSASYGVKFITEDTDDAPPETEEQKAARLAREKRIAELVDELESLGWKPADYDLDYV